MGGGNAPLAAVFLDRDGVVIENRTPYICSRSDIKFIAGAAKALRMFAAAEYRVVIVTNQAAVAKGLISLNEAYDIQRHIAQSLEDQSGVSLSWYLCPHAEADLCKCRKPQPGMLLAASTNENLDLKRSYLVGDAVSDANAALAVGVTPVFVLTGRGAAEYTKRPHSMADVRAFPSIAESAQHIVRSPII